jgi:beta propeller repeat protein
VVREFRRALGSVSAGCLLVGALAFVPASPAYADWLDTEQALTRGDAIRQWPQLSGDRLAYVDDTNEHTLPDGRVAFDVRVRNLTAGSDRLLTPDHSATGRAAISGARVVWPDAGDGAAAGLRYTNLATGESRLLAAPAGDDVAISGVRICYTHGGRVWVYDLRTDGADAVSPDGADAGDCDLSGTLVTWQDNRNGHDRDVYVRDLATGVETRVTSAAGDQTEPKVDGRTVVWQDARSGADASDVHAYDLGTGTETVVSDAPGMQGFPDVSDGRVVWMDERLGHGDTEVFLRDLAAGVETRVTATDGWAGNPTISGARVVYEGDSPGHNLYQRVITPPGLTLAPGMTDDGRAGFAGALVGAGGVPVVAGAVNLQSSPDGNTWTDVVATRTAGDGSFAFPAPDPGTVWVRAVFVGTKEYAPAASAAVRAGQG